MKMGGKLPNVMLLPTYYPHLACTDAFIRVGSLPKKNVIYVLKVFL